MGYIKNSSKEIGDWVTTTREHCSLAGKFTKGSKVRIIDIDPIRGYGIFKIIKLKKLNNLN